LGENPARVYNVGGMGIENIKRLRLLTKEEFEHSIDFKLAQKNILVTFHPVTLEDSSARDQFQELLDAIDAEFIEKSPQQTTEQVAMLMKLIVQ